jgi:hypothetical protein
MRYQLVLQWPSDSMETYDAVIDIEDVLIDELGGASDVDGHDVGSGETNVFIWTDDPLAAFERVQARLCSHPLWADTRAAFRADDHDRYTVIRPKGLSNFKIA